jgi:translation initiation factor IF-2
LPIRVYELARELNYSLTELEERQKDLGLILNSPFSMVPDPVAEKVKGKVEKRDPNPCLERKKPVRKAVKKKPKPKKVDKEVVVDETLSEESSVLSDSFSDVAEESSIHESPENVAEVSAEGTSLPSGEPSIGENQTAAFPVGDLSASPELGKISQEETNSDDEFQVGRIVGEAPAKAKSAAEKKKKKKRALVDPSDRLAEWSTKYGVNFQSNNNIKKKEVETKGSKLQRMQLVYGHELPKKARSRDNDRQSVEKSDTVQISCPIPLKDLTEALALKTTDVITWLMGQGTFMTLNDKIEKDLCESIALQYEKEVEFIDRKDVASVIKEIVKIDDEKFETRPPVLTIMGHVDHGKTSLLDTIRQSKLAEGETGGITQHIGGYQVEKNGQLLTFLDTPGHAAFTSMRARGANVTDLVILVVAADDGMMPQTEEAVNHAKAAGVPIVVAINKMDLEGAEPNRVKEQLAAMELIPEEWSGTTPYIPVSAKTGEGIDDLLEMLTLQTEMLELKADYKCLGEAVVVEAHQEPGRGVVASVLVQNGYLGKGDPILCGRGQGFLRQLEDEDGNVVDKAGPSKIVKVTGLSECPSPGDILNVMPNIKRAREMAEERLSIHREDQISAKASLTMDSLMDQLGAGEVSEHKVIVKADVQGSVEALDQALSELGNEEVRAKVIHKGVGAVSEADVNLAKASGAVILAFRVSTGGKTRRLAADEDVEIRQYTVIYNLLEEVEQLLEGMLEPEIIETLVGEIEVQMVFRITGVGNICGSFIKTGYAERGMPIRLVRDGTVVFDGKIQALRRFKEDVKRVERNYECGIRLENFDDIREGDTIETYHVESVKKTL